LPWFFFLEVSVFFIYKNKINKLPRHQRIRKILKIFSEAERRFCSENTDSVSISGTELFTADELNFYSELAAILEKDTAFSPAAINTFKTAAEIFAISDKNNSAEKNIQWQTLQRTINAIRHILVAETGRCPADWDFLYAGRLDPSQRRIFPGMFVYFEDIRSPFNVGAMFRTAESFGVEKIYLSPLCADPRHPRSLRSSMGCVDILGWERLEFNDLEKNSLISVSEREGLQVFALETGGIPLEKFEFPEKGILIAGSEELGVDPQSLELADAGYGRVSIPCYGAKGSLNVSVAFGIVIQAWGQFIISADVV